MLVHHFRRVLAACGLGMLLAAPSELDAGVRDLVITEIQAINNTTIQDENGDYSDWLEIYHPGPGSVNIDGCYLTDDPLELTKWRCPSVTLDEDDFLIVFCSDKDRRNPGSELHANFRLTSAGENLLLVDPDGSTIIWQYRPFPELVDDFSYGVSMNANFQRLVEDRAPARVLIPDSGDSALASSRAWTQAGFNDLGWISGSTGIGYENSSGYEPLIQTNVGPQMSGVNTTAWIRIPFTVTDPDELEVLVLRMKYDDGFIAYINGVEVASDREPSTTSWDSAATDDHPDPESTVFREWTFSNDGLLQTGTNVLAIHGLNRSTGSSDFLILPELDARGTGELNLSSLEYFNIPTPGSGNAPGYPGISPKPVPSEPSRVFQGSLSVALTVDPEGADIRYTTNGSNPTESSTLYTGPINITTSTQLLARSFTPDLSPSGLLTETYLTIDASLASRTSTVPIVVVDTFGGSIPGTNSTVFGPAFMAVFDRKGSESAFSNVPDIVSRIGIRARGSSTGGRPKLSYRFEFWDDQDDDKDLEPLGLPRESDWILYGAYNFDQTHMRNPFIYELSRHVGRYAARTRFVEVYLNQNGGPISSSDYWGVYSFMENLKRGDDRVDIARLDPSDTAEPEITGGYLLKKDRSDPGGSGSFSAGGVSEIQFSDPEWDEIASVQRSWIQNHLSTVFTTSQFTNYIDPVAAVDHHILNAMPKNVDAFRLSGYFYKERSGPVVFGPIWDFDRSMDSTDGRDDAYTTWRGTGDSSGYFAYDSRTPYWSRWLQEPDFLQLWKDRWFELREGPMSNANILWILDTMAFEIREAALRDQARWGQTSNWPGAVSHLKTWLQNRCNWIDSQWLRIPRLTRPAGIVTPGALAGIQTFGATYYTLDGSDPRLPGGAIAPGATQYDGDSIVINENIRLVARTRASSSNWSAPTAATYVVTIPPIVISELMYHPDDPEPDSIYDADDFEFAEVLNVGTEPVSLAGFSFIDAIDFTFSTFVGGGEAILPPGERAIIVSNLEAFQTRYDTTGMLICGEYTGRLNNAGETLQFVGPLMEPIHLFEYSQAWYPITDGLGYSLSVVDPYSPLGTWGDRDSWAASTIYDGTPGADDSGLSTLGGWQRPGDSNQDGVVDLSDGLSLLLRLFAGGDLPCEGGLADDPNKTLLNVNGDPSVNLSDAVYILNYLFQGGPAPTLGTSCIRIEGCPSVCRF